MSPGARGSGPARRPDPARDFQSTAIPVAEAPAPRRFPRVLVVSGVLVYSGVLLGVLAFLCFVVAVPYILLAVLPIPVLIPVPLLRRRAPGLVWPYLSLQTAAVVVLLVLRVIVDLWLPVRV